MIWRVTIEMHVDADTLEGARDQVDLVLRYADEIDRYAKSQVSYKEVDAE